MAACPSLVVCALSSQTRSSSCVCNLYSRGCETQSRVFKDASKGERTWRGKPRMHGQVPSAYFCLDQQTERQILLFSKDSLVILEAAAVEEPGDYSRVCIHRKLPMLWQGLKNSYRLGL